MSPERGLTTPYREEAALKQAMIASGPAGWSPSSTTRRSGKNHLVRFASWSRGRRAGDRRRRADDHASRRGARGRSGPTSCSGHDRAPAPIDVLDAEVPQQPDHLESVAIEVVQASLAA